MPINALPTNKKTLSRQFTSGLFNPELAPRDLQLNDLVQEVVIPQRKLDAERSLKNRIQTEPGMPKAPDIKGVPIPLTIEESEEADRQIAKTLERIQATYTKLASTREKISAAINSELDGKELSFKVDISKKRRVERAIKSLYGERLETITYSMYLEALKAKAEMEKKEVSDYANGITSDDEDDDSNDDRKNRREDRG